MTSKNRARSQMAKRAPRDANGRFTPRTTKTHEKPQPQSAPSEDPSCRVEKPSQLFSPHRPFSESQVVALVQTLCLRRSGPFKFSPFRPFGQETLDSSPLGLQTFALFFVESLGFPLPLELATFEESVEEQQAFGSRIGCPQKQRTSRPIVALRLKFPAELFELNKDPVALFP
ncbi:unnamed protein product [Caenorhabditis sp. 36 PRJEB53466]|nr:unnamed protein product [Caenorhabditis sp. 36 PRJEB53466]